MAGSMKIVHLTIGVILSIPFFVSGQDKWQAQGCTNNTPFLERIGINGCTAYDPDEFIIFHTNQNSFNLNSDNLQVRVEVQNGPFISNSWSSNPHAINALNNSTGCARPLFLDPFSPPYNGVIPRHAKVWAFVQQNPNFTGDLNGLCNEEAIFVIFGNFSHHLIRSMFANSCSDDCERNIIVNLGNCQYDIVYHPEVFSNKQGDYIASAGSGMYYGTAPGCRPAFQSLPSSPPPDLDISELKKCSSDMNHETFTVKNGDSFTSWHWNPTEDPFYRGSNFTPSNSDFPENSSDAPVSKSIWVYNYYGGRRSESREIKLTTLETPFAEIIIPEIECSSEYFEPILSAGSHLYGNWSVSPPVAIDLENGRIRLHDLSSAQE